jgi:hypothetical protein
MSKRRRPLSRGCTADIMSFMAVPLLTTSRSRIALQSNPRRNSLPTCRRRRDFASARCQRRKYSADDSTTGLILPPGVHSRVRLVKSASDSGAGRALAESGGLSGSME